MEVIFEMIKCTDLSRVLMASLQMLRKFQLSVVIRSTFAMRLSRIAILACNLSVVLARSLLAICALLAMGRPIGCDFIMRWLEC